MPFYSEPQYPGARKPVEKQVLGAHLESERETRGENQMAEYGLVLAFAAALWIGLKWWERRAKLRLSCDLAKLTDELTDRKKTKKRQ